MAEVTLSLEAMRYITAAEDAVLRAAQKQLLRGERLPKPASQLKIHIRDCVEDTERLFFVVDPGQLGLALGRQAKNLQTLKGLFKKECKFIEYSDDPQQFLRNLFKPFRVESVALERLARGAIRRRRTDATGEDSEGSPTGLDEESPFEDVPPGMTIVREGGGEATNGERPAEPADEAAAPVADDAAGATEAVVDLDAVPADDPAEEPAETEGPADAAADAAEAPDEARAATPEGEEEMPDEVLVARVTIHADDKGKAIGKGGKNIKVARLIAKRHHDLWDVQVV